MVIHKPFVAEGTSTNFAQLWRAFMITFVLYFGANSTQKAKPARFIRQVWCHTFQGKTFGCFVFDWQVIDIVEFAGRIAPFPSLALFLLYDIRHVYMPWGALNICILCLARNRKLLCNPHLVAFPTRCFVQVCQKVTILMMKRESEFSFSPMQSLDSNALLG